MLDASKVIIGKRKIFQQFYILVGIYRSYMVTILKRPRLAENVNLSNTSFHSKIDNFYIQRKKKVGKILAIHVRRGAVRCVIRGDTRKYQDVFVDGEKTVLHYSRKRDFRECCAVQRRVCTYIYKNRRSVASLFLFRANPMF